MTTFKATNKSSATLKSAQSEVWEALTDPELLPKLTPYLNRIDVEDDRWTWHVTRVPVLGKNIGSIFTEVMTFDEPKRIVFDHDPRRTEEKTQVQGEYHLEEAGSGTRVSIELSVSVELPFPSGMRRPVEGAIGAVMAGMGRRFASNLLRHLGEK